MASQNSIKAAIAEGRKIRGLHLTFPHPGIIELLSLVGIDYVYLDGEHGAFDNRDLEYACVAAELYGLTVVARVPDGSQPTITRFLDRGVTGVIVPHVDSVEDARAVVDAAYFGPIGNRSFGGGRPKFTSGITDMPAHMAALNERMCVSIMIETVNALERAGDIAALPGVDFMSFGMIDLAQSLGHPGNPGHPEVQAAVKEASDRIRAAGKPIREDFITVGWINDLTYLGARQFFAQAEAARN